jgi:hypothetical protein
MVGYKRKLSLEGYACGSSACSLTFKVIVKFFWQKTSTEIWNFAYKYCSFKNWKLSVETHKINVKKVVRRYKHSKIHTWNKFMDINIVYLHVHVHIKQASYMLNWLWKPCIKTDAILNKKTLFCWALKYTFNGSTDSGKFILAADSIFKCKISALPLYIYAVN